MSTGFWRCVAAVRDIAWNGTVDEATSLFGEFSVKLILDGPEGMPPTLVMLSNHQNSATHINPGGYFDTINNLKSYLRDTWIYARTASLAAPHKWSGSPMRRTVHYRPSHHVGQGCGGAYPMACGVALARSARE